MPWIYAFRDAGYETGVKVGCDSSTSGFQRFQRAGCYTPRGIVYEAAWRVEPARHGCSSLRGFEESWLHPRLAARHGRLAFPNNGAEWFDTGAAEVVATVSSLLGKAPDHLAPSAPKLADWDDFRNPKDVTRGQYRQVLWVYREHLTDRLKAQRLDDWATPREARRTYSRNGFFPVAAFTAPGPTGLPGNVLVDRTTLAVRDAFAGGELMARYGWLRPDTRVEDVRKLSLAGGLVEINTSGSGPDGVRRAYNRSQAPAF